MASQDAQPRVELKVARVRKGLRSQVVAAKAIGIERRVLWRAEAGHGISLENALKIATFYEQPIEDLFGADTERAVA